MLVALGHLLVVSVDWRVVSDLTAAAAFDSVVALEDLSSTDFVVAASDWVVAGNVAVEAAFDSVREAVGLVEVEICSVVVDLVVL